MGNSRAKERILAVGPTPPPINGMSVATEFLLRTRAAQELGLSLVDTADRRGLGNVGRFDLGNVIGAIKAGGRFLVRLIKNRPDVVYVPIAQNTLGFLRDSLFLIPARLCSCVVVLHIHGGNFHEFYRSQRRAMRWLVDLCVRRVDTVIVLGECLRGMLEGLVPEGNVEVVPNGIEDVGYGFDSDDDSKRIVLWMSKMDKRKGYGEVLASSKQVCSQHSDVEYMFAGEWLEQDDEDEAARWVTDQGLEERVFFLGPVGPPEKYELLARASIFVLPSRYEGQPFAIIEAMCFGVPVVTSPAGCIAETVVDGVTGFLIGAGDQGALAEKINALLDDPELAEGMGRAGRERFLERYTFAAWDDKMSRILESAAHRTPREDSR